MGSEVVWREATEEETRQWMRGGTPAGMVYRLVSGKGLMVPATEDVQ